MIALIVGTNREGSLSSVLTHWLAGVYKELGIDYKILDLTCLPSEIFSPKAYLEKPEKVKEFTEIILESSGIVVVTPEYNGSMSGALKLFIDMLPFPESFENRPICYVGISSGQFGALRPVEHLQQVFGYRNAYNFPKRVFIPSVHKVVNKEQGVTDQDLIVRLKDQVSGFISFCRSLGKNV